MCFLINAMYTMGWSYRGHLVFENSFSLIPYSHKINQSLLNNTKCVNYACTDDKTEMDKVGLQLALFCFTVQPKLSELPQDLSRLYHEIRQN